MYQTIKDHSVVELRNGAIATILERLTSYGKETAYLVETEATIDGMMKTVLESEIQKILYSPN